MHPLVIAVVAERGAGKGLFVKILSRLLPDFRIASLRFSDIPREVLATLGKEISRENMQIISTALRSVFREEGIYVSAMQKRIQSTEADVVILDGLRKKEETELLKKPNSLLLYIRADQRIRFERRRSNPENTDETEMSWDRFLRQEQAPTETSIRHIGETMADFVIENNDSVQDFENKIKKFLDLKIIPRLR